MKTYIWGVTDTKIIVQADSLEQAIGYANLEIEKIKEKYLKDYAWADDEMVEKIVKHLRRYLKQEPVILEPFKCVIL